MGPKHFDGPERRIGGRETLFVEVDGSRGEKSRLPPEPIIGFSVFRPPFIVFPEALGTRHKRGPGEHDVPFVHSGGRFPPPLWPSAPKRNQEQACQEGRNLPGGRSQRDPQRTRKGGEVSKREPEQGRPAFRSVPRPVFPPPFSTPSSPIGASERARPLSRPKSPVAASCSTPSGSPSSARHSRPLLSQPAPHQPDRYKDGAKGGFHRTPHPWPHIPGGGIRTPVEIRPRGSPQGS